MEKVSTVEMQIAERARKYPDKALTNLHEFIDVALLHASFNALNRRGASGVDAETWKDYNEQREERIPQLLAAFKSGNYRAPNIADLNQKLRGHYAYYGVTFNIRRLNSYYYQTRRLLHKWLNHRGGKRVWTWEKVASLTDKWMPLEKPRIYHSYRLAKP